MFLFVGCVMREKGIEECLLQCRNFCTFDILGVMEEDYRQRIENIW